MKHLGKREIETLDVRLKGGERNPTRKGSMRVESDEREKVGNFNPEKFRVRTQEERRVRGVGGHPTPSGTRERS